MKAEVSGLSPGAGLPQKLFTEDEKFDVMIVKFCVHPMPHVNHTVSVNIHSCFLHNLQFGAIEDRLFALNPIIQRYPDHFPLLEDILPEHQQFSCVNADGRSPDPVIHFSPLSELKHLKLQLETLVDSHQGTNYP